MEPYLKLRTNTDSDGFKQIQLWYFSYGKMLLLNSTVKTKKEYWDNAYADQIDQSAPV